MEHADYSDTLRSESFSSETSDTDDDDTLSESTASETSDNGDRGSQRGHPLIDSTSYTVPGNPLAPLFEHRHTPFSQIEPLAPINRQVSLVRDQQEAPAGEEASHRGLRRGTPVGGRKHKEKRQLPSDFKLPEIVAHDAIRDHEDVLHTLTSDGILTNDSKFIRHTRSGIAYHYMYGPPVSRPRRLPRIVSEGAVRPPGVGAGKHRKNGGGGYLLDSLEYDGGSGARTRGQRKQPRLGSSCQCSGGRFTEDIRCAVNKKRLEREARNTERVREQLAERRDKIAAACGHGRDRVASAQAKPGDERAARMQEVRAKQDELRKLEARRAMENFMKQKKRKQ